ncbi:hypothetical protein MHU86_12694 [Fragilaria crotonensis]|nr:hypothetical protein MHU86_12694 [Fragilaria crotonensis]
MAARKLSAPATARAAPVARVDVYVDDFLLMAQTEPQKRNVLRNTLQAIDDVFRPLEPADPLHCKEPASVKKMLKGDACWSTRKRILGWDFDTRANTMQLPQHRLERLYDLLQHLDPPRKRASVTFWHKLLGELRSMSPALPGSKGLFSILQHSLHTSSGNRVRITKRVRDMAADFRDLADALQDRPTRLPELHPREPHYIGASEAYLLVPAQYFDQAKEELRLYRLRLSPPSHREARFRDSVLDLPDEIHIKTAADSNVSFMDTLSTADVWQKLPTYLGKPHSSSLVGKDKKKNISTQFPTKQSKNAWTTPPAQSDQNSSDKAKEHQQVSEDDSLSLEGRLSVGTDDLSTASTQSLTLASDSKYQTKLKELEVATKKKLESLQIAGRAASKQLESLEEKFQTFATDTSKKIEEVQSELQQVVKQLEESVDT